MPGQPGTVGQLAERSPYPSGGSAQPSQFGQLAIGHHFSLGHLPKRHIQSRSSGLVTFGVDCRFGHARLRQWIQTGNGLSVI